VVICSKDAYDIDADNRDDLISFVNQHFLAEMPRFERENHQNIYAEDGAQPFTAEYKSKAVETVCMHNTYQCATAVNGCKREKIDDQKQYQTHMPILLQTGLFIGVLWNATIKLYHITFT
jgi:hypothetical protein